MRSRRRARSRRCAAPDRWWRGSWRRTRSGEAGMRTAELDEVARDVLARAGAFSPFLSTIPFAPVPFPAAICTSVNDAALHGIPGRYKLADGDLLSVDSGAVLDGWAADAAVSFTIGAPRPADAQPDRRHPGRARAGIAAAIPAGGSGTSPRPRHRRAQGRLRDLHRLRRPRRRPGHARGPTHPQRGRPRARSPPRPRPGHRDRAVVPGRGQRPLPDRP